MWVCKAKGSRSIKCFIQVQFTYLLQHITRANAVVTIQISSAKQERKLCTVDVALGALCCLWWKLDLLGAMRTQVLIAFYFFGGPGSDVPY